MCSERRQCADDARMTSRFRTLCSTLCALALLGCKSGPAAAPESNANSVYLNGAVAADHPVASQAGLEMLKQGGNAVDAAVATSFCLSVVRPESCGIGGGGFMLIYLPATADREARCVALNYRETSPAAVGPDYFAKAPAGASKSGAQAVAVPGTVKGLCHALEKYGTLKLPVVLAPAIRAAEHGVRADATFVESANELAATLEKYPELREMAAPIWMDLCDKGRVRIGDIVRQPHQARALKRLAEQGPDAFYKGEIARAIVQTIQSRGGAMTLDDLASYSVCEYEPLHGDFHGHEVFAMPPPSSGGVAMIEALGIVERRWSNIQDPSPTSADYVHLVTEAFKHAFADRAEWLADPAFVDVPTDRLLDFQYLNELATRVKMDHTNDPFTYGSIVSAENPSPPPSDSGTSHLCAIDSAGMAVACTETINLNFGSLLTVQNFGIILNDEMDDFTTRPGEPNAFGLRQSTKNSPQPGKRPLSSMSPTILVKDGRVTLIVGASGGPRIITATTQCILNCVMFGMTPQQSIQQARFHHQWLPNVLVVEDQFRKPAVMNELVARGHEVQTTAEVGNVQMIVIDEDGILAASDPRKGGVPAGH